jgi:aconitate hydratase
VELKAIANGVSAKDVILEVLRILSVKGGVGKIVEYFWRRRQNAFVRTASITTWCRARCHHSIFPSEKNTRKL